MAGPFGLAPAHGLLARVSLLFVSVGIVRLSDRGAGSVQRLHTLPLLAIGTLLIVAAAIGTFVCGWACPFGFLQDLLAKIPTPKFVLPSWAGYFRYLVLVALVVEVPYCYGEASSLFFCRLCPAGALEGAVPAMIKEASAGHEWSWPSATKITILATLLVSAFFTWRPWCTVFCPLGAIYGLGNRFSVFFLRFHRDLCIDCRVCRAECPDGGKAEQRIDGIRCLRCLECSQCRGVSVGSVLGHGP